MFLACFENLEKIVNLDVSSFLQNLKNLLPYSEMLTKSVIKLYKFKSLNATKLWNSEDKGCVLLGEK